MKETYLFIGKSGCGKGTQADLLLRDFREKYQKPIFYLETGQRFRDFAKKEGYANDLVKIVMDEGGLMPEFMAVHMWAGAISDGLKKDDNFVIDGTPRKFNEVRILESALDFFDFDRINIIYINVSDRWSIDRMKERGRADDTDYSIEKRLEWFQHEVAPIVEHYKKSDKYNFLDINGEQVVIDVHNEINEKLGLK